MKKLLIIFIFILIILPIMSAVEFDMKSEFSQGETLIAKISGNFKTPILQENIFFYRGHVRISMDYDVAKIDDDFYIYALLSDKSQGNYSLNIKDVQYMKGSQIIDDEIQKNFTITNKTADFSVKPGFIITQNNFYLEVQNLKDSGITININTETVSSGASKSFFSSLFGSVNDTAKYTLSLKSGEIEKINFEIANINESVLKKIYLKTDNSEYGIPIYAVANKTNNVPIGKGNFKFDPTYFYINMSTNSETNRIIYLINKGERDLKNISLEISEDLSPYIFLSEDKIDEIKENSSAKIELYIISPNQSIELKGNIKAKEVQDSQNFYESAEITLNFVNDFIPANNKTISTISKTCLELNGVVCGEKTETCNATSVYAKDAYCCLGDCNTIEEGSSGKMIGWILALALLGFLIWFYMKYIKR